MDGDSDCELFDFMIFEFMMTDREVLRQDDSMLGLMYVDHECTPLLLRFIGGRYNTTVGGGSNSPCAQ
jgi:hypothetical protein